MKKLLICLLLTGCQDTALVSKNSSTVSAGSASTVYKSWASVLYYDNTGSSIYKTAYFNVGLEQLEISGSQYTFTRNGSTCTSVETGTITLDANNYTYSLTNRAVTNTPAGNCTVAYALTAGSTSYFSPTSWNIVIPSGALSDYSAPYFMKSDRIGLKNPDTNNGGMHAYYVMLKQ